MREDVLYAFATLAGWMIVLFPPLVHNVWHLKNNEKTRKLGKILRKQFKRPRLPASSNWHGSLSFYRRHETYAIAGLVLHLALWFGTYLVPARSIEFDALWVANSWFLDVVVSAFLRVLMKIVQLQLAPLRPLQPGSLATLPYSTLRLIPLFFLVLASMTVPVMIVWDVYWPRSVSMSVSFTVVNLTFLNTWYFLRQLRLYILNLDKDLESLSVTVSTKGRTRPIITLRVQMKKLACLHLIAVVCATVGMWVAITQAGKSFFYTPASASYISSSSSFSSSFSSSSATLPTTTIATSIAPTAATTAAAAAAQYRKFK